MKVSRAVSKARMQEAVCLFESGLSCYQAALQAMVDAKRLRSHLAELGIDPKANWSNKGMDSGKWNEVERLHREEGLTMAELSRRFGISRARIRRAMAKRGIKFPSLEDGWRRLPLNETAFDNPQDPECAYWVGFLMADGCVTHTRTGKNPASNPTLTLGLKISDIGHIEKFRAFLGSGHKIHIRLPKTTVGPRGTIIHATGLAYVRIQSRRLVDALRKYGIEERKTVTAKVELLQFSPDFWRGCIDGDGTVGVYRNSSYSKPKMIPFLKLVGTEVLTKQFAEFVHLVSPSSKINAYRVGDDSLLWRASMNGSTARRVIEAIYGFGGTSLDRKQAVANQTFSRLQA